MNHPTLFLLRPFFKGNTLESEFGFVNYYHSNTINRLLHTFAIPLLIYGILSITYSIDYRLALVFSIFYCAILFLFHVKTALSYVVIFTVVFRLLLMSWTQNLQLLSIGLIVLFIGLAMQGIGHYKFQKFAPAFRLFEAIFTTPAFLMMYLITSNDKAFWDNVEKETKKWKQILSR